MAERAAQRLLERYGYALRPEPSLVAFLRSRQTDCVIDVGANEGQYARQMRRAGYAGRIVSFEPVQHVHDVLARNAAGDGQWDCIRAAVGAQAGTVTINVSRASVFSSIRKPTEFGERLAPMLADAVPEEVSLVRIDDVPELADCRRPFLKIDTQGYEQPVLDGAEHLLRRAVGLQLELPILQIYDGVWNFIEAVEDLRRRGFVPAQFRPVTYSREIGESLIEVDCVFRPLSAAD